MDSLSRINNQYTAKHLPRESRNSLQAVVGFLLTSAALKYIALIATALSFFGIIGMVAAVEADAVGFVPAFLMIIFFGCVELVSLKFLHKCHH